MCEMLRRSLPGACLLFREREMETFFLGTAHVINPPASPTPPIAPGLGRKTSPTARPNDELHSDMAVGGGQD